MLGRWWINAIVFSHCFKIVLSSTTPTHFPMDTPSPTSSFPMDTLPPTSCKFPHGFIITHFKASYQHHWPRPFTWNCRLRHDGSTADNRHGSNFRCVSTNSCAEKNASFQNERYSGKNTALGNFLLGCWVECTDKVNFFNQIQTLLPLCSPANDGALEVDNTTYDNPFQGANYSTIQRTLGEKEKEEWEGETPFMKP